VAGIVDGLGGWAMSACVECGESTSRGVIVVDNLTGEERHRDRFYEAADAWRERALSAEARQRALEETVGELLEALQRPETDDYDAARKSSVSAPDTRIGMRVVDL